MNHVANHMQVCVLVLCLKCKLYGLDHRKLTGKYKPAMLCLHVSSGFVSAFDYVQVEWNSTKR